MPDMPPAAMISASQFAKILSAARKEATLWAGLRVEEDNDELPDEALEQIYTLFAAVTHKMGLLIMEKILPVGPPTAQEKAPGTEADPTPELFPPAEQGA